MGEAWMGGLTEDIVIKLKNNTSGNKDMMIFEVITRWSNLKATLYGHKYLKPINKIRSVQKNQADKYIGK